MKSLFCTLFFTIFLVSASGQGSQADTRLIEGKVMEKMHGTHGTAMLVRLGEIHAGMSGEELAQRIVLVEGHPKFNTLIDGDPVKFVGRVDGTYEYPSGGGVTTFRVYKFVSLTNEQ